MKKRQPGRPKGSTKKPNRVVNTISLHKENWKYLDSIGPSRGKAVDQLIELHKGENDDEQFQIEFT